MVVTRVAYTGMNLLDELTIPKSESHISSLPFVMPYNQLPVSIFLDTIPLKIGHGLVFDRVQVLQGSNLKPPV